jgi:GST-like protein
MSLVFYAASMSSASPVAAALEELGVPHEKVVFDLSRTDHKKPEFLKLNPNGKVPTLVVDGTPMFEALAIIQWLGDRYGVERKLWPAASSPARLPALSWTTWSYVTFGSAIVRLHYAQSPRLPEAMHNAAQAQAVQTELAQLLDILAGQLAGKAYLLGDEFSLVDLVVSCTLRYATYCGVALDKHPVVAAYVARCFERPALKQAMP